MTARRIPLLLALCALAAALVGACSSSTAGTGGGTGSPVPTLATSQSSTSAPGASGNTSSSTTTSTKAAPHTSTHHSTATSGAVINSFAVSQQPRCPVVATSDAPFSAPGQPVTLTWDVSGASDVALSIDDPNFYASNHTGSYGTYPPSGSVTIDFQCNGMTQPNTTHTYTLDTVSTPSREKTLTVTVPTNP
jgi:hypothetical protein